MNKTQKTLLVAAGVAVVAGTVVLSRGDNMPNSAQKPIPPKAPNGISICLDPGHGKGANNVGATNPNTNVLERDEVLRAAFILERFLLQEGFKVSLTRRTDDAPGEPKNDLPARISAAINANADLLLSLHMDCWAINNKPCRGAGVLFNRRAGQAMASEVAKALDAVTPGTVYTDVGDWLYIANYHRKMLLVEIDRVQRLSDADLTARMKAISNALSKWYTQENT